MLSKKARDPCGSIELRGPSQAVPLPLGDLDLVRGAMFSQKAL